MKSTTERLIRDQIRTLQQLLAATKEDFGPIQDVERKKQINFLEAILLLENCHGSLPSINDIDKRKGE